MSSSVPFIAPTYLDAAELHELLTDPSTASTTLVVDVREDDFRGGNVYNALNVPAHSFRQSTSKVIEAAKDKKLVVFHCMQSQVRGPKCARIMAEHVAEAGLASFPTIVILADGFSGWMQYVADLDEETRAKVKSQLIANYVKSCHGYNL